MNNLMSTHRTVISPQEARSLADLRGYQISSLFSEVVRVTINPGTPAALRLQFRSGVGGTPLGTQREVVGLRVFADPSPKQLPAHLNKTQQLVVVNDRLAALEVLNTYVVFGSPMPVDLDSVGETKEVGGSAEDVRLIHPESPVTENVSSRSGSSFWLNEVDVGVLLAFDSAPDCVITTQGFTAFVNVFQPGPDFNQILGQTRRVTLEERINTT